LKEVVHHINHDRSDNRIQNLMLFDSRAAHSRHHEMEKNREREPVAA